MHVEYFRATAMPDDRGWARDKANLSNRLHQNFPTLHFHVISVPLFHATSPRWPRTHSLHVTSHLYNITTPTYGLPQIVDPKDLLRNTRRGSPVLVKSHDAKETCDLVDRVYSRWSLTDGKLRQTAGTVYRNAGMWKAQTRTCMHVVLMSKHGQCD